MFIAGPLPLLEIPGVRAGRPVNSQDGRISLQAYGPWLERAGRLPAMVGGPTDGGVVLGDGDLCSLSGPDQEKAVLSCPAPTPAPQGHPNTWRQLEHSLPLP